MVLRDEDRTESTYNDDETTLAQRYLEEARIRAAFERDPATAFVAEHISRLTDDEAAVALQRDAQQRELGIGPRTCGPAPSAIAAFEDGSSPANGDAMGAIENDVEERVVRGTLVTKRGIVRCGLRRCRQQEDEQHKCGKFLQHELLPAEAREKQPPVPTTDFLRCRNGGSPAPSDICRRCSVRCCIRDRSHP